MIKNQENSYIAHDRSLSEEDSFTEALKSLQRRFGLKVTGIVDQQTMNLVNSPRCGFPDQDSPYSKRSPNAFTLGFERWRKLNISYRVIDYSKKLNQKDINRDLERAFSLWSKHIPLKFNHCPLCHSVDIKIRFVNKSHG